MPVKFQDFSFKVKAAINETTLGWLYTWSNEIAAQAQRNCKMDGDVGKQLKGSYSAVVDSSKGQAKIGSPLESAYWEEWGTGEHAAHGDGRKGWWVYVKGEASQGGGKVYTQAEAQAIAESMQAQDIDAYATDGREPNYTLDRAFGSVKNKAVADLKNKLKGMGGK